MENLMPWVREVFMPDVPNEDLLKYQDKLKLFYMKTLDFIEANKMPVTKETILKNADKIRHWDIASKAVQANIEEHKANEIDEENIKSVTIEPVSDEKKVEKKPCACIKIAALEADMFKLKRYGILAFVFFLIVIFSTRNNSVQ